MISALLKYGIKKQVWSSSMLDLNKSIKTADAVVVAKVTSSAAWSQRDTFDANNRPLAEKLWVGRVPMHKILVLRGSIPDDFNYVEAQTTRPFNERHEPSMGTERLSPGNPTGRYVLLWLYKQADTGRFRILFGDSQFAARDSSEYQYAHQLSIPELPVADYAIEGNSAVERYCSILVQAYAQLPDSGVGRGFLRFLDRIIPRYKLQNGEPIQIDQDEVGPGFFVFAQRKLAPRLFAAAGTDEPRLLRANYYAYRLTGLDQYARAHRESLSRLEEIADPNEKGLVDGLLGDRDYAISKMDSRLVDVRVHAIDHLEKMPQNIPLVARRLADDGTFEVKYKAVDWLDQLRVMKRDDYRDAPIPRVDFAEQTIVNLVDLVEYWMNR
jgi:hypothetical protein